MKIEETRLGRARALIDDARDDVMEHFGWHEGGTPVFVEPPSWELTPDDDSVGYALNIDYRGSGIQREEYPDADHVTRALGGLALGLGITSVRILTESLLVVEIEGWD